MMEPILTHASEGLSWCVDSGQILVFDVNGGVVHRLRGYPAILWEWMTGCYDISRLIAQTSLIMNCPDDQARSILMDTLESWHLAGLLTVEN